MKHHLFFTVTIPILVSIFINGFRPAPAAIENSYKGNQFTNGDRYIPKKYALLIGINDYPHATHLNGCVNDITAMKTFLLSRGFAEKNIIFLPDGKATKAAIIAGFQTLRNEANNGDIVVIHFSGHGSQVLDHNHDEIDGWDETLVPYDYNQTEASELIDDDLDRLLTGLTNRTQNVTVILDACHSGGGTKLLSIYPERFLPPFQQLPENSETAKKRDRELSTGGSGYATKDAKYVLITGCRSDQKSQERPFDGIGYNGVLTHFLIQELTNEEGRPNWPDLMENVKYKVKEIASDQTPQLEGDNANSYVFGDRAWFNQQFLRVSPMGGGNMTVSGGVAQGVTKGSVFNVFDPSVTKFDEAVPVGQISITDAKVTSAVARLDSGAITKVNSKARLVRKNYIAPVLHLAFAGDWNTRQLAELKAGVKKLESVVEDKSNPYLLLKRTRDRITIHFASDTQNILNHFDLNDTQLGGNLYNQINLWVQWFHVMDIENPKPSLNLSIKLAGTKDLDFLKPDYEFNDGDEVMLTIKNLSDEPVFVNIIDLQDNADIEAYHLSTFKDQSRKSNDPLPPGQEVAASFHVSLRAGTTRTVDVLKIFATTIDTDFKFLEQGSRQQPQNQIEELTKNIDPNGKQVELDDWFTVSKIIVTKSKVQ